ncbi:MAG: hypothetical protein KKA07_04620, partial [Bacteroidetes bacterium]|nr:hypothetical protein [Bacteroidota bacterium]MBU1718336.1 hypothetical protein [Bacteroidota bacterium]
FAICCLKTVKSKFSEHKNPRQLVISVSKPLFEGLGEIKLYYPPRRDETTLLEFLTPPILTSISS